MIARKEGLPVVRSTKRQRDEFENDGEDGQNGEGQEGGGESSKTQLPPAKEQRLIFNNTPNKILLAQNLPLEIQHEHLQGIFQACSGYLDVRIVPGGRGLAFIEFENEIQSGIALRQFNGFQLTPTYLLNLTYAN